jgi:hypothetical protein
MEFGENSERESQITRTLDGKSRNLAVKDFRCFSLFLSIGLRSFFALLFGFGESSMSRRW